MTDRVLLPVFAVLLMVLAHRVLFYDVGVERLTNSAPSKLLYLYPPGQPGATLTTSFSTGETYDCMPTSGAGCLGQLQVQLYENAPLFVDPRTVLTQGSSLQIGQQLTAGTATLVMGADGNLALFDAAGGSATPIWTTNTSGNTNRATLKPDGNLVVADGTGETRWASGTDFGAFSVVPGAGYTLTLSPAPPGGTANLTLTNQMGATVWTAIQGHEDLLPTTPKSSG